MTPSTDLLIVLTDRDLDPNRIEQIRDRFSRLDIQSAVGNRTILQVAAHSFGSQEDSEICIQCAPNLIQDVNRVMKSAADAGRHLLLLLNDFDVSAEALAVLEASFRRDPHFGMALPRKANSSTGEISKLQVALGDPEIIALPPEVLNSVEEHYILPERPSECLLIRNLLLTNLYLLKPEFTTLAGALHDFLTRARRAGFRTVVCNKAIVAFPAEPLASMEIAKNDLRVLYTEYPDISRAATEFADHPLHRHESFLARAQSPYPQVSKSLLLDLRGIPDYINGTSEAALALCDGLHHCQSSWRVSYLSSIKAANFHRLGERFAGWTHLTDLSNSYFTAALRPSQPWSFEAVFELHKIALLNLFLVLDTIAWDILYEAPYGIEEVWNFMFHYSDAIFYDSDYTRDRVNCRFPAAALQAGYVARLSLRPEDYIQHTTEPGDIKKCLLVIGNSYDHKNLKPTVDLLQSSFPFEDFTAIGLKSHQSSRVSAMESGRIDSAEMVNLYSRARLIIVPSFYEGFGFPIVRGLSYGKTVVARESLLLREIAGHYRGPGKLVSFSTPAELLEKVRCLLDGDPTEEIALGASMPKGAEPNSWQDTAASMLRIVEDRAASPNRTRWMAREHAVRLARQYALDYFELNVPKPPT